MVAIFETYGKEIIALAVPVIAWALSYFFRARAKLLLATTHTFTFLVQVPLRDAEGSQVRPDQTLQTRSLLVTNSGRATATKVELVFNWKPLCLNVWPPRHFDEITEPDKRYTLVFDSLAPNEHLDCHLLAANNQVPDLVTVRCDQGVAKEIPMLPQPVFSAWQRRVAAFFLFAGVAAAIYGFIVLLQFLVLKTPLGH